MPLSVIQIVFVRPVWPAMLPLFFPLRLAFREIPPSAGKMTGRGGCEKINSRFGIIPDLIGTLIAFACRINVALVNESVKYSPRFRHYEINVDARN